MVFRMKVDGPGEFLAALPYLLGVCPRRQVIVAGGDDESRLTRAVCVDTDPLPDRDGEPMITQIPAVLARHGVAWVLIASIDDRHTHPEATAPLTELIEHLEAGCAAAGITVAERIRAATISPGAAWRTAIRHGTVPDASTSPLAVSQIVAGRVIYPNRDAIVADLSPTEPDSVLADRAQHLTDHPDPPSSPQQPVQQAIARAREGELPRTEEELTTLARALHTARGEALALARTATEPQAVRELWIHLMRTLPGTWRCEPGVLAAITLALTGQPAIADVAVDLAAQAAPEHRLPSLLRQALSAGISDDELTQLLTDASIPGED